MKTKKLLVELIEYLELFEQVVPGAETMGMTAFLAFVESMHGEAGREKAPETIEADIARHLSLLHRYSRSYIKRALAVSDCLQSEEEYTYLVCLMRGEALTKTELHQRNGLEKTTGAEVLRRLRRHELISEEPAPDDRRSVLVRITPRGRAELMRVFPTLRTAADVLTAPLDAGQREIMLRLLEGMTDIHSELASSHRDASLADYAAALGIERPHSHG